MADTVFDQAISESLRIATASAGANLAGFSLDLAYVLEQRAGFTLISVIKTGDQRCLLCAMCSAQPAIDAAAVLVRIWEEDLRYAAFAAHRIRRHGIITELEFVTRSGGNADSLCVTGLISVSQPDGDRP